jgi:hypothetical protein
VSARRLVLSLFFRAALGVERVFHFETLDYLGFAILSGGKKVMSRSVTCVAASASASCG